MKAIRWGFVGLIAIFILGFVIESQPLFSPNQAAETAKKQLGFMGYSNYDSPESGFMEVTYLSWYNHGRLFGTERIYVSRLFFQPKPGAQMLNFEVLEDARSGKIISTYQYRIEHEPPF